MTNRLLSLNRKSALKVNILFIYYPKSLQYCIHMTKKQSMKYAETLVIRRASRPRGSFFEKQIIIFSDMLKGVCVPNFVCSGVEKNAPTDM